jgi:hypothetical protein
VQRDGDASRRRRHLALHRHLDAPALDARPGGPLLFDPQTSGGLLFGVPAERADAAVAVLHDAGELGAAAIGRVVAGPPRVELT